MYSEDLKTSLKYNITEMLAHHPVSGKPIRILRTEAQISSDRKTLVWVRDTFISSSRWQRYFTLITEPAAVNVCGPNISAIVIRSAADVDAWLNVFPTIFVNKKCEPLIVASEKIFDILASKGFTYDQSIITEELYDNYPYLGEPVKADDDIEKIIISVAHVLRINHIIWSSSANRELFAFTVRAQIDAWIKCCAGEITHIAINSDDSCIPRTWLIQQYYVPTNSRRAREIHCCLEKNIECPLIDNIILLNEQEYKSVPKSPKIQTIIIGHRLTYYDVMNAALSQIPLGAFAVFSNSDIWFNETLSFLWKIDMEKRRLFLALLRWEDTNGVGNPYIFGPRADSQDSWIFARSCLNFEPTIDEFGFPFGKSGCDNAITIAMMKQRFLVVNPAYSIHTMHMHASNIRTYDPKDVLYKTHFLYVEPTPIQFCKVVKDLTVYEKCIDATVRKAWSACNLKQSFRRPVLSVRDVAVKTLCTMLQHNSSEFALMADNENLWTPAPTAPSLYNFRGGSFITLDGLISNFKEIYVGNNKEWERGWEATHQSSLMTSIHVPALIALPAEESSHTSLSSWVLYYLPRALQLQKILKAVPGTEIPEFLVPQVDTIGSFLNDCEWPFSDRKSVTVVPMVKDMNYYSENVWAPSAERHNALVTKEDIQLLRTLLPKETVTSDKPVAVFFVEDAVHEVCTRGWAEEVADKILSKGWTVRYVSCTDSPSARRKALSNAAWIFGSGNAMEWIWYAPPESTVMEFMLDSAPRGDIVHLAGAADIRYVLGLVKREPIETQRQNALLEVGKALKKFGFDSMLASIRAKKSVYKMTVVMPTGAALDGIWNHSGDRFREMVEIWGDRGYVTIERSDTTGHCWWGGIGQTLLYDRPTSRWWSTIPTYQLALFGNCPPPGPDAHLLRQSAWCFWPRSPRAIETLVRRGDNLKGWDAREINSLFLGKVENGVQQSQRTGKDWRGSVELFSMPIDYIGKPYPFSQTEYLEKLCNARFGLCLAGLGPKCNREIEYFACGVVPIVTHGVDMCNYLVPPLEGVHYLCAKTPEEVKRIVNDTPAEKWAIMSAAGRDWWRRYCSADGLFSLTWARIEQCQPYLNVGIPKYFLDRL